MEGRGDDDDDDAVAAAGVRLECMGGPFKAYAPPYSHTQGILRPPHHSGRRAPRGVCA